MVKQRFYFVQPQIFIYRNCGFLRTHQDSKIWTRHCETEVSHKLLLFVTTPTHIANDQEVKWTKIYLQVVLSSYVTQLEVTQNLPLASRPRGLCQCAKLRTALCSSIHGWLRPSPSPRPRKFEGRLGVYLCFHLCEQDKTKYIVIRCIPSEKNRRAHKKNKSPHDLYQQ